MQWIRNGYILGDSWSFHLRLRLTGIVQKVELRPVRLPCSFNFQLDLMQTDNHHLAKRAHSHQPN